MRTFLLALLALTGIVSLWLLLSTEPGSEAKAGPQPVELEQVRSSEPARPVLEATRESAPQGEAVSRASNYGTEKDDRGWLSIPPSALTPPGGEGRYLIGRVTDADGIGLGGAQLTLEIEARGVTQPIERASSRSDGRYWIRLPRYGPVSLMEHALERDADEQEERAREGGQGTDRRRWRRQYGTGRITQRLHVTRSGYLPEKLALGKATPSTKDLRRDIVLEAGHLVTGRIVDDEGRGVSRAEVRLVSAVDLFDAKETQSEAGGSWHIAMPEFGIYHLHARREGVGAAVLEELEVPPLADAPLPDLMLRGEARLEGRIVYPSQRAASGVRVEAVPAELHAMGKRRAEPDRLLLEETRGGLWGSYAVSDDRGQFRIDKLAGGPYVLAFSDHPELEDFGPVATSATDLILEYPIPRLKVEVRGPGVDTWSPLTLERELEWTDASGELRSTQTREPVSPGSAAQFFQVPEGSSFRLALHSEGEELAQHASSLAPGAWEYSVTLWARRTARQDWAAMGRQAKDEGQALRSPTESSPGLEDGARALGRRIPGPHLRLMLSWSKASDPGDQIPKLEVRLRSKAPESAMGPIVPIVLWPIVPGRELRARLSKRSAGVFETDALAAGPYTLEMRLDGESFGEWEVAIPTYGRHELQVELEARPMPEAAPTVR